MYTSGMFIRQLRKRKQLAVLMAIPSVVGCPVIPPASQWGPTDVGCLDHWSLLHFGSGLLLGGALGEDGLVPTVASLVGWEAVEPSFWPGETALNQQCDIAVGSLGWFTSHAARQ